MVVSPISSEGDPIPRQAPASHPRRATRWTLASTSAAAVGVFAVVAAVFVFLREDLGSARGGGGPDAGLAFGHNGEHAPVAARVATADAEAAASSDMARSEAAEAERQRAGTARPGPAPDAGEAVRLGEVEVARVWAARARSAPLVVVLGADARDAVVVTLLTALRRTRDYHIAVIAPAVGDEVAAIDAAIAAARAAVVGARDEASTRLVRGVALLVAGERCSVGAAWAAGARDVIAVAWLAPALAADAQLGDVRPLYGRQLLVMHRADHAAAQAVARTIGRAPLARVDAREVDGDAAKEGQSPAGAASELAGLLASPRAMSDLMGWLFAVTPAAE